MAIVRPDGNEWAKKVLKNFGIDPSLVKSIVIESFPYEPIIIRVEIYGNKELLDIESPTAEEAMVIVRECDAEKKV